MWAELLFDFRIFLGIEDQASDTILRDVLEYSESYIFEIYHLALVRRDFSEHIYPIYGNTLYTKYGNIFSIDSITINDSTTLDSTDYRFSGNKIFLKTPPIKTDVYNVSYSVGWDDKDDIPYVLRSALYIIAKKLWNDARKDTDTLTSISLDIKQGLRIVDEIPVMAQQILEPHRIVRL